MSLTLNTSSAWAEEHPSWVDARCRRRVLDALRQHGCAVSQCPEHGHDILDIDAPGSSPLRACIRVHRPRFYRRLLLGADVGAAEAYLDGDWSTTDLTLTLRVGARLTTAWTALHSPLAALHELARRTAARLRRNTRAGSRRNIAAHYDLSNEFFSLFLDSTLTYSAAYFPTVDTPLEQASEEKLDQICRKLALGCGEHVLEIGTGWGSFALHAAGKYGCRVTTATISAQQYELARARVRAAGLDDKVEVLLRDYRDLQGQYDKLVSIEMIEAVGHEFLDTFFSTCSRLLKADGQALIQAISSRDQDYERARKAIDFIKKYIFPGGCLTSISAMVASMTRSTDLQLYGMEDLSPHYALTLCHWRENFNRNGGAIRELGFDERFLRMWNYYFAYCEAGFTERNVHVAQLHFVKPGFRAGAGTHQEVHS